MNVPEEIIKRVFLGDEEAYEQLFRFSWDQAVRTCWLILRHKHDSEEVAQEAFLKLYLHRGRLKDTRAFHSWFYRILINTALDRVRKRKLIQDVGRVEPSLPSDDITHAEHRILVRDAMKSLSYDERTAIVLVHFLGLTEPEAARVAGWRMGKLKYRLNRARHLLASEINNGLPTINEPKGGIQYV